MGRQNDKSVELITSLDGSRSITVEEFDRLFDEASDEIDQFIDWSKARRRGQAVEVRVGGQTIADHRRKPSSDAGK